VGGVGHERSWQGLTVTRILRQIADRGFDKLVIGLIGGFFHVHGLTAEFSPFRH